jgi:mannan endo-1,4-beta-mannosidase
MWKLHQQARFVAAFSLLFNAGLLQAQRSLLVDTQATKRTEALFLNLQNTIAKGELLFGHQDDLAYGVGWREKPGGSDVKAVCGDYPAVYGWELGNLEHNEPNNLDSVNFNNMKTWIREGYQRGGVITLSWHMDNYHTGGSAWDTTAAVRDILPGGVKHEEYKADLDNFVEFLDDLEAGGWLRKHKIPIIFRPFHEHTGGWFWWGKTHATPEEFKQLWRFTVSYLRDTKKVHHLLYSFSTAGDFTTLEEFMEFYPGDEWVDMLGFDDYSIQSTPESIARFQNRLRIMVETAEARGKVPALTECGQEGVKQPDWYTQALLKNIQSDPLGRRISYALVWRNANSKHHYTPYPGHQSVPDFELFYKNEKTLFERDLVKFYKKPKVGKTAAASVSDARSTGMK